MMGMSHRILKKSILSNTLNMLKGTNRTMLTMKATISMIWQELVAMARATTTETQTNSRILL